MTRSIYFAEKDACSVQELTSLNQTPGDDHNGKDAPISSHTPSQEETTELLKQVPCFTELEPRSTNMNDFFSLTNQFFVKMAGDPPITVVPCLPRGTPESVLSRIKPIQDHTAVKTAEVVKPTPSQFEFPQCLTSNTCF